jgi:hypothetical protein
MSKFVDWNEIFKQNNEIPQYQKELIREIGENALKELHETIKPVKSSVSHADNPNRAYRRKKLINSASSKKSSTGRITMVTKPNGTVEYTIEPEEDIPF